VGRRSAAGLTESGYVVTVIERDPEQCANFPSPQASRVVEGDGTDVDVLQQANPSTASVVAGLTDDTATNLAVCELASELAPQSETVLRIASGGEQEYAHLSHVDSTVYPAALGAEAVIDRIVPPATGRPTAGR
jgi:trk system potassium uptake protein TrkA